VLSACKQAMRPGGRIVFSTIEPAAGLSDADRRRAHRAGPPANAVRTSYEGILRSVGFDSVESNDVTTEYRATQQRWIQATESREGPIRAAIGDDVYVEDLKNRRATLRAIDAGLLARVLYSATKHNISATQV
jgi:hypothetical protein